MKETAEEKLRAARELPASSPRERVELTIERDELSSTAGSADGEPLLAKSGITLS